MGTIQQIALTFSITSVFFKVLSKPKDIYPNFKYRVYRYFKFPITVISVKIQRDLKIDFQVKLKVLLSNRKLTGRKRIAFDNNVHKIAKFSDELENVKQLNFSLQKFESDNIEFEKRIF